MHSVLRIIRTGNTIVSFVGTLVGGLDVARFGGVAALGSWTPIVLAALSTACVTAGGNVLNDLGDIESDRRNHPDRPLVTGEISPAESRWLAIGLFVVSIAAIVPLLLNHPALGAIWAAAILTLFVYELRLKSLGLAGNACVAFLTAAVFLYGAAAVGSVQPVVPFALMAFFATLSREVIKDMEDAEGDVDRATLPRTHGLAAASGVARLSAGVAIALSPSPFFLGLPLASAGGIIYLALVAAADALFVASVAWLPVRLHQEQTTSKRGMTVALGAFLAFAWR